MTCNAQLIVINNIKVNVRLMDSNFMFFQNQWFFLIVSEVKLRIFTVTTKYSLFFNKSVAPLLHAGYLAHGRAGEKQKRPSLFDLTF